MRGVWWGTHTHSGEAKSRASTLAPSISLSLRGQRSASLTLIHSRSFIATCIHTRSWARALSLYFYACLDTPIVKLELFLSPLFPDLKYARPNRGNRMSLYVQQWSAISRRNISQCYDFINRNWYPKRQWQDGVSANRFDFDVARNRKENSAHNSAEKHSN